MNRETIEKAANARYEDNTFSYKGFITGAEWRINSAWHDMSEKPNGIFVILIDFGGDVEEYSLGINLDGAETAKRWAYISDLIP
ncbi:MAG TPA: hypothetical protein IAC47_02995 [Candidatus Onthomorpha intestinigallinarum]|uniref:Uncharacterized protein n=1 Tax=Candidatus Onthomorpha intestinigallinarum TaxID=2840880 RepID=A0A9D1UGQ5_9BACT|nr:hypothetical protein [Candidatus Onthomorpha intestinigallinarum]